LNELNESIILIKMYSIEQLEKLSMKIIYRELLKNMKFYPSKNRF